MFTERKENEKMKKKEKKSKGSEVIYARIEAELLYQGLTEAMVVIYDATKGKQLVSLKEALMVLERKLGLR